MLPWFCLGSSLVLLWFFLGSSLVLPWCSLGSSLVLPWLFLGGTFLVLPRCHLNDPESISRSLFSHDFHHFEKACPSLNRSRERTEKPSIPSERSSKTMGIHIEIDSFDELCPWITWIQRAPGHLGGGTPPEPYYARPLLTWRRVLRTIVSA